MTSLAPHSGGRHHVWPTWLVSAKHRAVISNGDDSGWFPVGVLHARRASGHLTACGLFAIGWPMFWAMPFEGATAGSCQDCAAALTRPTTAAPGSSTPS